MGRPVHEGRARSPAPPLAGPVPGRAPPPAAAAADLIQWVTPAADRGALGEDGDRMIVQFNVRDFLDRAEMAYPDGSGSSTSPISRPSPGSR